MSPGARTIPAAMVLPTAADIPNHIPRTLRRRPRLGGMAGASKAVLDAGTLDVEALDVEALDVDALDVQDRSDGFGKWVSLRDFAKLGHDNGRRRKCKLEVAKMRGAHCALKKGKS